MTASRACRICSPSTSSCPIPTSNSRSCRGSRTPRSSKRTTGWSIIFSKLSSRSRRRSIAACIREAMMRKVALLVALVFVSGAARAAEVGSTVDMAAAKREGAVRWYTSTPVAAAQSIANLFEKQTGIKVELFRSGGSAVLSRFMQEPNAGTKEADVLTTSDPAAAATLAKRGVFVAFTPVHADKIPAEVKDPSGYWIAQRLNLLAIAVKSDAVKQADRPKTWSDLTDAKYKGLEVMPDPSFTSLQLVAVGTLSKALGWGFYEKLKQNDIMIVQGHEQTEAMVKRGERPIAAEELDSYAADDRKAGHEIVT